jgi:hypothetical protein
MCHLMTLLRPLPHSKIAFSFKKVGQNTKIIVQNFGKICHVTLWLTPPSPLWHLVTLTCTPLPRSVTYYLNGPLGKICQYFVNLFKARYINNESDN